MNFKEQVTEYWHTSRTALAGLPDVPTRGQRINWVTDQIMKNHPRWTEGCTRKSVYLDIEEQVQPTHLIS